MKEIAVSNEEQILEQYGFLKFPEIVKVASCSIRNGKFEWMKDS